MTVGIRSKLDRIAWLVGHWRGEALGGIVEEIWSPAMAGSMMGSFRLVVKNEVKFYELMTITEEQDDLLLKIKHFHPDLKGWEQQDKWVESRLLEQNDETTSFDGFVFKRLTDSQIKVSVASGKPGAETVLVFDYIRYTQDQ